MNEVLVTSAALNVLYALFALVCAWLVLRMFDRAGKVDFKIIIEVMTSEPVSAALYFGLRFIGVCVLIGMVIS